MVVVLEAVWLGVFVWEGVVLGVMGADGDREAVFVCVCVPVSVCVAVLDGVGV